MNFGRVTCHTLCYTNHVLFCFLSWGGDVLKTRSEHKKERTPGMMIIMHFLGCMWQETCSFSHFRALFRGCERKKMTGYPHFKSYVQFEGTPGTCEQSSRQKYFVLFSHCHLFLRFFLSLPLCSCQDWQASVCYQVTWSSCLNNHDYNPGYFKACYWLREPPPRLNSFELTLTDSISEVVLLT
jgi:hypothetical protein